MSEKPILFSGPMVRAILAGRKWMTRRFANPQPPMDAEIWTCGGTIYYGYFGRTHGDIASPYQPGDCLWIREAWRTLRKWDDLSGKKLGELGITIPIQYEADNATRDWPKRQTSPLGRYRHARFMPRWVARTVRPITDVRAEQLQDITEEDAKAEGVGPGFIPCPHPQFSDVQTTLCVGYRPMFVRLWDEINGTRHGCAWADNPWVWAISFARMTPGGGRE